MKRRYAKPTIPYEAWKNLKRKHEAVNIDYKKMTGRKHGIPFTKFILSLSQKPTYFEYSEIVNLKRTRRKSKSEGVFI